MRFYTEFDEAFLFLENHPAFAGRFQYGCLEVTVVKVNPETEEIDEVQEMNTETRVWLECGRYEEDHGTHDIELDCGAPTYEEAILKLANLVLIRYGDYGEEEEIPAYWDLVLSPTAQSYLLETIKMLADSEAKSTIQELQAVNKQVKERLMKIARNDVSKEDLNVIE